MVGIMNPDQRSSKDLLLQDYSKENTVKPLSRTERSVAALSQPKPCPSTKEPRVEDYLDFRGLLMTRVNSNSIGMGIPVADRLIEKSGFLRNELNNELEKSRQART